MAETESNLNCTALAVARFREGFSCSQSVLSAFAPDLGLDADAALRVSAAFGGGMGRTGGTCGAVTGALMVLGLKYGATAVNPAAKALTSARAREFMTRFQAHHGATVCAGLLGVNIGTPEGHRAARDADLFKTVCPGLAASAALILQELGI
jgi:C_GCAxxG_C_C family probable redox protein